MRRILFVQGAGDMRAPESSARLLAFLRQQLGKDYDVCAPEMPGADEPRYEAWRRCVVSELARMSDGAVLVGHSLGGSALVKSLASGAYEARVAGLFLVAAPFWREDPEWALPDDFVAHLPTIANIFLYHSRRDPEVPFIHVGRWREYLPRSIVRALASEQHSFTQGLPELVDDIRMIEASARPTKRRV